jgi:hypothetical protein
LLLNLNSILDFLILPEVSDFGNWMGKSKGFIKTKFHWKID